MCWGYGFLTSPRALARRVIASRRPAVTAEPAQQAPQTQPSAGTTADR